MLIDLSLLPTSTLIAMRNALLNGNTATASVSETAELKNLRIYKSRNETLNHRREVLRKIGIDIEDDLEYWLSFDTRTFEQTARTFATLCQGQGSAKAERLKIPPMVAQPEKTAFETALKGLKERKYA